MSFQASHHIQNRFALAQPSILTYDHTQGAYASFFFAFGLGAYLLLLLIYQFLDRLDHLCFDCQLLEGDCDLFPFRIKEQFVKIVILQIYVQPKKFSQLVVKQVQHNKIVMNLILQRNQLCKQRKLNQNPKDQTKDKESQAQISLGNRKEQINASVLKTKASSGRSSISNNHFSYDALKDEHNSYYFQVPSVQRHLIRLKNIVEKTHNPQNINISNSIEKLVKPDAKNTQRGLNHRKIYIADYDKYLKKFSKRYFSRMRKNSRLDHSSPSILPPIGKNPVYNNVEQAVKVGSSRCIEEKNYQGIQHYDFLRFLNNKKMQASIRKIYFQGSRTKTE